MALGSIASVGEAKDKKLAFQTSTEACQESGVTLVVDRGGDPDQIQVRCVKDFDGSGWQLFSAAELKVEGTAEYPESFVCRINGFPAKDTEDCLSTPNYKDGTWVYFNATADTSKWMRSGQGAASRSPKCGDYEGWRFVTSNSGSETTPRAEARPFTCSN